MSSLTLTLECGLHPLGCNSSRLPVSFSEWQAAHHISSVTIKRQHHPCISSQIKSQCLVWHLKSFSSLSTFCSFLFVKVPPLWQGGHLGESHLSKAPHWRWAYWCPNLSDCAFSPHFHDILLRRKKSWKMYPSLLFPCDFCHNIL